jgi:hypothetical protein
MRERLVRILWLFGEPIIIYGWNENYFLAWLWIMYQIIIPVADCWDCSFTRLDLSVRKDGADRFEGQSKKEKKATYGRFGWINIRFTRSTIYEWEIYSMSERVIT